MSGTLVVPALYRGPATSGNGGWVSGSLACLLGAGSGAVVQVRLSAPPPLDVPLPVVDDEDGGSPAVRLLDGDTLVARAHVVDDDTPPVPPIPPVSFEAARAAGAGYPGPDTHPFPSCFACSPVPPDGEGLRLATGPLSAAGLPDDGTAAAWVPHPAFDAGAGNVTAAVTWAALDCPGAWSLDLRDRLVILGTMTARIDRLPRVGERCVVRGAVDVPISPGTRTSRTRTTLYGEDGDLLGVAAHVWVLIDPSQLRPA